VSVGPFESTCDTFYELLIHDFENPECFTFNEEVTICCSDNCLEPIFEVVSKECSETMLELKLALVNPLDSDELWIMLNNVVVENYQVEFPYLYLTLDHPGLPEVELSICVSDPNGSQCCYSQKIELECNFTDECRIGLISAVASDCLDTDLPSFIIDFDYENIGNEGFNLKGNGIDYGDFKYEDLPIYINVEDNCDITYEFVVIDNEFECSNYIEDLTYCCADNCSFGLKDVSIRCDDGVLTEIAFYLQEDTDPIKEYLIYLNGKEIASTSQNNIFLEFPTDIEISNANQFELTVCDLDCCVTSKLDLSECLDPPVECEISNVETSGISCSDNQLNFTLNFDHKGTSSAEFDVFSVFGFFGTFKYEDLPIKIEDYPSVILGLNAVFVCDKASLCCQAHLFSSPLCLSINDDISFVEDQLSQENHRFIEENPARSELILSSPVRNTKYQLLNSSGKLVRSIESMELRTFTNISDLKSGLYIVRIEYKGEIKIEKLIITN